MAKVNAINNKSEELTIDPGASGDSKFQFSINGTGEFVVGVDDDAADAFKISQGLSLGTNDFFEITANGERVMDLQPSFNARNSVADLNVTGDGTLYTIIFDTEEFDAGSNYNNSTGIFTAPITGKYFFCTAVRVDGLLTSHTSGELRITTSNNTFIGEIQSYINRDVGGNMGLQFSAIADMDASDTAKIEIKWSNGTKVIDIAGSSVSVTHFSGALLC